MNIELSREEIQMLLVELGIAAGMRARDEEPLPREVKAMTDKILLQVGGRSEYGEVERQ